MPHRDPQTGQFMSDDAMSHQFDDIEAATFNAAVGIPAADLGGGTGFTSGPQDTFEGLEVIDYDDIVDRNEELHLLSAQHAMTVYANSTESADGTVRALVEISASPSQAVNNALVGTDLEDTVDGRALSDDTIDIVGRPLDAVGHAPFSDSASGVGGGGSAGEDSYEVGTLPAEMGRFHPRDELFVNGIIETWNIDDSGVHVDVTGQHVYGVVEQ